MSHQHPVCIIFSILNRKPHLPLHWIA
jgi:hypothetical protein